MIFTNGVATKSLKPHGKFFFSRPLAAGRHFSAESAEELKKRATLVQGNQNVHSNMQISKSWRNKPLFRRQGDVRFKTGLEAANLLVEEAKRRDDHEVQFIESVESTMHCLSPIFERNPRYAFVAKQLMEPERFVQFRVPWLDDVGVTRMNRGYRIQFSSSLGPYVGPLHLGSHVNSSLMKSLGFDAVFSNALTGYTIGAAVGGSDICPFDKSESEMQRFCQSFMTELVKYIGPDIDLPTMGKGVGEKEIGYMFGQYKRINIQSSSGGKPFMTSLSQDVSAFNIYSYCMCLYFTHCKGTSLIYKPIMTIYIYIGSRKGCSSHCP
jgi:glutamate dehydrogenase (NADP+)